MKKKVFLSISDFLKVLLHSGWCSSVDRMPACKPKHAAAYIIMLKVHWWTELSDDTTSPLLEKWCILWLTFEVPPLIHLFLIECFTAKLWFQVACVFQACLPLRLRFLTCIWLHINFTHISKCCLNDFWKCFWHCFGWESICIPWW